MASLRLKNQTVTLNDGEKVRGKNIRMCSPSLFEARGGTEPTRTVGLVYQDGWEIPVKRTRGRSRWIQAGCGMTYYR